MVQSPQISLCSSHILTTTLYNTGFALSLRDWPASIEHLHLEYRCDPPLNENKIPPKRSEAGKDALCLALHRLSQQLVTLELEEITIGPELFWPPETQKNSPPQWPKLTRLMITYMSATPSGHWLFERDPRCPIWNQEDEPTFEEIAEGQSDHYVPAMEDYPADRFRSKPLPLMNEIYKAAGLAAQHMPLLKDMAMAAQIQGTFIEVRQGSAEHLFRYTRETARVKWVGVSEFHPTKEVMDIWKGVGREHGLDRVQIEVSIRVFRICCCDVVLILMFARVLAWIACLLCSLTTLMTISSTSIGQKNMDTCYGTRLEVESIGYGLLLSIPVNRVHLISAI